MGVLFWSNLKVECGSKYGCHLTAAVEVVSPRQCRGIISTLFLFFFLCGCLTTAGLWKNSTCVLLYYAFGWMNDLWIAVLWCALALNDRKSVWLSKMVFWFMCSRESKCSTLHSWADCCLLLFRAKPIALHAINKQIRYYYYRASYSQKPVLKWHPNLIRILYCP